ncbi:MAG: hypothetical protein WC757_00430 [Candidatus Paceibacterota bacterium]|jgi:hypothetical protein
MMTQGYNQAIETLGHAQEQPNIPDTMRFDRLNEIDALSSMLQFRDIAAAQDPEEYQAYLSRLARLNDLLQQEKRVLARFARIRASALSDTFLRPPGRFEMGHPIQKTPLNLINIGGTMADMGNDLFAGTPYGKAALNKLTNKPENFRFYEAEIISANDGIIKMTGAQFRVAKHGANRGLLSVLLKDTIHVIYVTRHEIEAQLAL